MAFKVFISHAKEDSDIVRHLYDLLKRAGFNPWFDEVNLIVGQQWKSEIEQVIEQTDVFIFCLSNAAVHKKGYVHAELNIALDQASLMPEGQVYILPVRLDNCQIPFSLRKLHVLDYFKENGDSKLLQHLKKIQNKFGHFQKEHSVHEVLALYQIFFAKEDTNKISKRIWDELKMEPEVPVYNLLYCIAILKNVDLTLDNLSPKKIEELYQRLEIAQREKDLLPTNLFIIALIVHDYYETRFRTVSTSSDDLIAQISTIAEPPIGYLIGQLNCSISFHFKTKFLLR
ncbi:toll/interleukin-1 receptor domain-containing protein [Flavilitoribacter nigricans]|uniref:TIR domain-containing protein n=1 Tax=Flavilitoribacter nigricans (strain ATCC 23147 / DSM 23189 / NBRC 102662 / NCIMB 1420 / SS-2) TaxID=1122177 RepID=A0A2D0N4J8_FLAN2|nr:toll/interleukin-1 receptor domain-containing protein [Flavilitoribacter nigricans]PHN03441.1 hypothetical protein CRP01_27555 [Flavilitoribacter nigricans DSM 23189 = NBRC 102662]